jgi:hypothetical protein
MRRAATTEPLPLVDGLRSLSNNGVRVRRGELVMIAGIPNAGKSAFALWWIASLNLPTLYFSADNSAHQTVTRLLGDITAELSAYVEMYDEWPEVIVVDNLINVEGTDDHQGMNGILSELHYCARMTGATVFVLHHMSEAGDDPRKAPDPTMPPPMRKVQGKVNHYPDLILSVAADSLQGLFRIAVPKNRNAKNDPGSVSPYLLWVDFPKCTFYAENPRWTPHDVLEYM